MLAARSAAALCFACFCFKGSPGFSDMLSTFLSARAFSIPLKIELIILTFEFRVVLTALDWFW